MDQRNDAEDDDPVFCWCDLYGRLEEVFLVHLHPDAARYLHRTNTSTTLMLALITLCKIERRNNKNMPVYSDFTASEVVDAELVKCLVGRVSDNNGRLYTIIDRSDTSDVPHLNQDV